MPSLRRATAAVLDAVVASGCAAGRADPPARARCLMIPKPDGQSLDAIELGRGADVAILSHGATGRKEDSLLLAGGSLGASLSISMAVELAADGVVSLSAPAGTFGALDAAAGLGGTPVFVAVARGDEPEASDASALASAAGVQARS